MTKPSDKKKLTRGEKWLLVAPLFFAALFFGVIWFRNKTKPIVPYLIIRFPKNEVIAAADLSSDSELLAISGGRRFGPGSGIVRVHRVATGQLERSFVAGDTHQLQALSFSPDGNSLASGFSETYIWNLHNSKTLLLRDGVNKKKVGGWGGAGSLAFSPDNRVLALANGQNFNGGVARLWDARAGMFLRFVNNGSNTNKSVPSASSFSHFDPLFSSDGKTLAVIAYDVQRQKGTLPRPPVKNVRFSVGKVQLWDVKTSKLKRVLPLEAAGALAFSRNSEMIVAASDESWAHPQLNAYNSKTGRLMWSFEGANSPDFDSFPRGKTVFGGLVFSPDNRFLFASQHRGLSIIDASNGKLLREIDFPASGTSKGKIDVSDDGKILLTHFDDGVALWNTDDWNKP